MYHAPTSSTDRAADRDAQRAATLQELAEIGMDLARALRREVMAAAEAPSPEAATEPRAGAPGMAEVGLAFSRISRAVRLTLALEARLEADGKAVAQAPRPASGSAQEILLERFRRVWRQADEEHADKVRDAVERLIEVEVEAGAETERAERLRARLDERLEAEAGDEDFAGLPIGEAVARICRDLGLTPDWGLWDDEDWGLEAAAASRERAPDSS
jgi:hypothetical protein